MLRTQHASQQGALGKKEKKGKKWKKTQRFWSRFENTGIFKRASNATRANSAGIIFEGGRASASARV